MPVYSYVLILVVYLALTRAAVLSNTHLPLDQNGQELLTGELSILNVNGTYWMYINDWGGCEGVDCCYSIEGCASCCFAGSNDACVYTTNHSIIAYSTIDFTSFTSHGVVLATHLPGILFRPRVVFNGTHFIMWYEDRWTGQEGYAVAVSVSPAGPFVTVANTVLLCGQGRVGDYYLFVDDDGSAYHVRTGLTIVKLTPDMTASTNESSEVPNSDVEAPVMFKRDGLYYLLCGSGCCACKGGASVLYYTSSSPLGPFTLQGDVNRNSNIWTPWSADNYVSRSQLTDVVSVTAADGTEQLLWVGNQWVTSEAPGRPRNNDLFYWTLLGFDGAKLAQFEYCENVTLSLQA